jgi:hypothetical protein
MRYSFAALRKMTACAAAALVIMVSAGPPRIAAATPVPPAGSGKFLDYHGPVLHAVQLHLIYWGRAWTSARAPNPRPDQITSAARTMLSSSYLTGLAQYRGIGRGTVRGSTVVTASDAPGRFTDDDVSSFLDGLLDAGTVPAPDAANQTVYAVLLLPSVVTSGSSSGFIAEHNYYTRDSRRIHYLWTAHSGSLSRTTWILSHEVVESATDPEGSGFRGIAGACSQDGWCEIADVCSASSVLDGVTVASYWSNQADGCVIPGPDRSHLGIDSSGDAGNARADVLANLSAA